MVRLFVIVLVGIFFASSTGTWASAPTLKIYQHSQLEAMTKAQLIDLSYSLQQRVVIDEAGNSPNPASAGAEASGATVLATTGSVNSNSHTESPHHTSPFKVGMSLLGAFVIASAFSNLSKHSVQPNLGSQPGVQRLHPLQTTSSGQLATTNTPTQSGACDAISYVTGVYNFSRQALFPLERYVVAGQAPSNGDVGANDVAKAKAQRQWDEAITTVAGAAATAASCGVAGSATITGANAAAVLSRTLSRPLQSTSGSSNETKVGPSGRQAFCNTVAFLGNSIQSNGKDWFDTQTNKGNGLYTVLSAATTLAPAPLHCNSLTPTTSQ